MYYYICTSIDPVCALAINSVLRQEPLQSHNTKIAKAKKKVRKWEFLSIPFGSFSLFSLLSLSSLFCGFCNSVHLHHRKLASWNEHTCNTQWSWQQKKKNLHKKCFGDFGGIKFASSNEWETMKKTCVTSSSRGLQSGRDSGHQLIISSIERRGKKERKRWHKGANTHVSIVVWRKWRFRFVQFDINKATIDLQFQPQNILSTYTLSEQRRFYLDLVCALSHALCQW